jgi:hypothetical protein
MHIKTDKELTIDLRNQIASRIIEFKANILYWKRIIRQSKTNSKEIVEALNSKKINEDKIEADEIFLRCIDDMLGGK